LQFWGSAQGLTHAKQEPTTELHPSPIISFMLSSELKSDPRIHQFGHRDIDKLRRRPGEDGSSNWSNAPTSQRKPRIAKRYQMLERDKEGFFPPAFKRSVAVMTLWPPKQWTKKLLF
jgi:hypothetical protein